MEILLSVPLGHDMHQATLTSGLDALTQVNQPLDGEVRYEFLRDKDFSKYLVHNSHTTKIVVEPNTPSIYMSI